MILQCDQCNTRFRLDDSKLKPGGVKVRCSKCRHVFLAGAEQQQEDSEFDAILSGLGAPAPEQREEAAAVGQAAAGFGFDEEPAAGHEPLEPAAAKADIPDSAAFEFPAEPAPLEKPAPAPETQPEADAFGFALESAVPQQAQATPAAPELDYGDFAFMEEPAALQETPAPAPDVSEFGEFSFEAEPVAKTEAPAPAPASPGAAMDFGEFEFNAEPVVKPLEPAAVAGDEFADFTFDEETAVNEQPPPVAVEVPDYGEFSFAEETVVNEQPPAAEKAVPDYGDFSFEEESVEIEEPPVAAKDELDFGDFSFSDEPAGIEELKPAAKEVPDFGDFSFPEEPAGNKEPLAAAKEGGDFGDFSFAEEPPLIEEAPAADVSDDFGSFSFSEELPQKQQEEAAAPEEDDTFSFGELSLPPDLPESPVAEPAEQVEAEAAAAGIAGAVAASQAGATKPAAPPVFPAADAKKTASQGAALDFDLGPKPVVTHLEEQADEEELPPLLISSRRKGRSWLTVSIVTVSVLVIIALSGAGLYLLQSGPEALDKFDKLGLGFVAKWFGMESPEEGRIVIKNPLAAFHQNKEAGEIFVVTGQAVNSFRKARASIHVKVSLFDKNGTVLMQKTAYCGNRLSDEQLATLPMAKIESIMNNQFGDSLANLGVKPGQGIGFVVAIANVPKEAVDFGVETVGSTVAGQ